MELGPELLPEVDEEADVDNGKMLLVRKEGRSWIGTLPWRSVCFVLRTGGDRKTERDFIGVGLNSQAAAK